VILVLVIIGLVALKIYNKDPYSFKGDKMYYSENRGKPVYEMKLNSSNETFDIYNLDFQSRDFLAYPTKIYGLLLIPKNAKDTPAVVLLPGGGVTKEGETPVAEMITREGYAVFTIDQRGVGQTGGYYLNFEDDYNIFAQGKEPVQHLSVYDALRAYDVLKEIKGIDKNSIAIAGESMGGRYAIIAGAVEKNFKGVIAISSAGFHVKKSSEPYNPYLLSVDPDHYIADVSPRNLFMLHSTNDTTVKIEDAEYTFSIAKEPKKFFTVQDCGHGYCKAMHDDLINSLKILFGK